MEIIPKCVGAPRVDPQPDQKVTLTFTKDHLAYRLGAQEAIDLGHRLMEVGKSLL